MAAPTSVTTGRDGYVNYIREGSMVRTERETRQANGDAESPGVVTLSVVQSPYCLHFDRSWRRGFLHACLGAKRFLRGLRTRIDLQPGEARIQSIGSQHRSHRQSVLLGLFYCPPMPGTAKPPASPALNPTPTATQLPSPTQSPSKTSPKAVTLMQATNIFLLDPREAS